MRNQFCIASAAIFALAGAAFAAPIYEQPFNEDQPDSGGWYSHLNDDAFSPFIHGDNFTLDAAASVTGMTWHGSSDGFFTPGLDNFAGWEVTFYQGVGDVPETAIFSQYFDKSATNPSDTGIDYQPFGADVFMHEVAFDTHVDLMGGTQYWVSVAADMVDPDGDGWVWAESPLIDDVSATFDNDTDSWEPRTGPDSAFALVPTPSTIGILGVAGLVVGRRRR